MEPDFVDTRGIQEKVLFVLASAIGETNQGQKYRVFHAFTEDGIRSRCAVLEASGWAWERAYAAGPLPWLPPCPYDPGETPEARRRWHERESSWAPVVAVDPA
jgi:hypothetical protein